MMMLERDDARRESVLLHVQEGNERIGNLGSEEAAQI